MKKITVAAAIDQLDNVQNFISEQLRNLSIVP